MDNGLETEASERIGQQENRHHQKLKVSEKDGRKFSMFYFDTVE
jgi:hypothetical protein